MNGSLENTTRLEHKRPPRGSGGQPEFKMAFTIIQGSDLDFGRTFQFQKEKVVIGRTEECDIRLADDKVSRRHCRVEMTRGESGELVIIHDLRSTNGTSVNGEPVRDRVLLSGDRIEIGSTILRFSYSDQLEEQFHARLFDMATVDELTGVYNKRYLLKELENHSRVARRNRRVFCLMVLDIDHFKTVNDQYGHLAGDEYLRLLSFTVGRLLREQDVMGRFGGEEFLIILPETPLEGAMALAERIRRSVADAELAHGDLGLRATVSIGVGEFGRHGSDWQKLLQMTDKAMYRAKSTGRNRVCAAGPE
jgi:diguanylate cyclase (GGDEF)-like protein